MYENINLKCDAIVPNCAISKPFVVLLLLLQISKQLEFLSTPKMLSKRIKRCVSEHSNADMLCDIPPNFVALCAMTIKRF